MKKENPINSNLPDKIQERIRGIKNARAEKLNSLSLELETTYSAIETQRKRVTEAAASTDIAAYRQERLKLKDLQESAKDLEEWIKDPSWRGMVSEKESEETFAALLAYEHSLENDYKSAAGKLIIQLKELTDKHIEDASAAEQVLINWENDIRPNYKSNSQINGGTRCEDGTYKGPNPIKIHPAGYYGWQHIDYIRTFLNADCVREMVNAAGAEEHGT